VEAYNKRITKQDFVHRVGPVTKIIPRCTVSKTSKFYYYVLIFIELYFSNFDLLMMSTTGLETCRGI